MTARHQHQYPFSAPASPRVVVITRRKYTPTTRVEHLLLLLTIVLLPMEPVSPLQVVIVFYSYFLPSLVFTSCSKGLEVLPISGSIQFSLQAMFSSYLVLSLKDAHLLQARMR